MKVFLSTDIEGTAGIVDWQQVVGPGPEYELGRALLLDEVNAAIDGAVEAGASSILVNDAHWTMQNMPPGRLHGRADYLSGKHKPLYMMEGLDQTFDAVFLIAYHGSIGAESAVLSHTYNPNAIYEAKLNGVAVGESAINALVALYHEVPVALITGDSVTAREAEVFMPGIETVVVKESVGRFAARSVHPEVACELIRNGARRALERLDQLGPPAIELPARIDLTLRTTDIAEMATWVRGVERSGARQVAFEDGDPLRLFQKFVTIVALTRGLAEDM